MNLCSLSPEIFTVTSKDLKVVRSRYLGIFGKPKTLPAILEFISRFLKRQRRNTGYWFLEIIFRKMYPLFFKEEISKGSGPDKGMTSIQLVKQLSLEARSEKVQNRSQISPHFIKTVNQISPLSSKKTEAGSRESINPWKVYYEFYLPGAEKNLFEYINSTDPRPLYDLLKGGNMIQRILQSQIKTTIHSSKVETSAHPLDIIPVKSTVFQREFSLQRTRVPRVSNLTNIFQSPVYTTCHISKKREEFEKLSPYQTKSVFKIDNSPRYLFKSSSRKINKAKPIDPEEPLHPPQGNIPSTNDEGGWALTAGDRKKTVEFSNLGVSRLTPMQKNRVFKTASDLLTKNREIHVRIQRTRHEREKIVKNKIHEIRSLKNFERATSKLPESHKLPGMRQINAPRMDLPEQKVKSPEKEPGKNYVTPGLAGENILEEATSDRYTEKKLPEIEIDIMANRVFQLLEDKIKIEKERRGL